jgi:hypothetical protein
VVTNAKQYSIYIYKADQAPKKWPPKNKRIQKIIAPKLKADPSGLKQTAKGGKK